MQDNIARHFGEIREDAASQADEYDSRLTVQNVRFEAALNNMTQGLCMFDGRGRLVVVNRRFIEFFGDITPGTKISELVKRPSLVGMLSATNEDFFTRKLDDDRMFVVSRQSIAAGGL